MSLRMRFLLSLLAVLALMAGPALYAVSRVTMLRDIVLELRGQAAQSALAVGRLEAALLQLDRNQRVFVATMDAQAAALMHSSIREMAGSIATLRGAGYGDLVAETDRQLQQLSASTTRLEVLIERGLLNEATTYLMTEAAPLLATVRAGVPAIAATIDLKTNARVPIAQRSAVAAGTATTAAVLVGVALAIALALASAKVLTGPLDGLRHAMSRVAEGTFETPFDLPYDRTDEVGDLSRSFRTMTGRLAELDRLKAEFVGTISHDLKTPVSVITGYAELIREELTGTLTSRQVDLLRSLSEQTRALQRRVDQLVEISRMESGRRTLELEEIDLKHFVHELHREFEPVARMRDIRLELSVHERIPHFVIADPDVLRIDVIGNVIGNALKFTPGGGMIRITARPDGQRVSFEISDTGPGIPHDQLERIFDKYYQSRGASGGSGLGLAIAKAGIENHGGRIEVQSWVGRGTRFRVTLPVRPATTSFAPVQPPVLSLA